MESSAVETFKAFAWALAGLVALGHVGLAYARARGRDDADAMAKVALWAGVWSLAWMAAFMLLPEAAYRGWLPGSRQPSLCEESPGSGCAACVASAEQDGVSTAPCYERPHARWALELAALGPARRAAARERLSR